ncbi:MAG: LD-carboxypeptidase [Nocardioides sp.]
MIPLRTPRPVRPGDRVAVVSPSWPAPELFPAVHEAAMRRLREELELEPVEYPTTRRRASPRERARDLNAAFADPDIRAVLATIGGDDQITVLRHLDPEPVQADPKPFLGYSDNTNLLNWLWFHGVAGVHGGSTQVHLGPGPTVHTEHLESLRAALFGGDAVLRPVARTCDVGLRWDDPAVFTEQPPDLPAEPWQWHGFDGPVTGRTWGGNLEILQWTLSVGRWVLPTEAYAGCVLVLETSEEVPSPVEVYRMLRNLGERGLLGVAAAVVWGRPAVSDHELTVTETEAAAARAERRDAVLRAVGEYHPGLPVVLDVDLGHTIPGSTCCRTAARWLSTRQGTITAHFGRDTGTADRHDAG